MLGLPYLVTNRLAPILLAMAIFGSDFLDQRFWGGLFAQWLEPNVSIFHPNFELFTLPQIALFEYCLGDADGVTISPLYELRLGACHKPYPNFKYIHSYIHVKEVPPDLFPRSFRLLLITVSFHRRLIAAKPLASRFYSWPEIAPLLFSCSPLPPSLLFFRAKRRAPSPSVSTLRMPRCATNGRQTSTATACEPSSPARTMPSARFLQYFSWAG